MIFAVILFVNKTNTLTPHNVPSEKIPPEEIF